MARLVDAATNTLSSVSAKPIRALFVVQERGHFREHIKLARALQSTQRYEPQFAVLSAYSKVEEDETLSLREGMVFHLDRRAAKRKPLRYRFTDWIVRQKRRMEAWLLAQGCTLPAPSGDTKILERHFLDVLLLAVVFRFWHGRATRALRKATVAVVLGPWVAIAARVRPRLKRLAQSVPTSVHNRWAATRRWLRKIRTKRPRLRFSALHLVTIPVAIFFRPVSRLSFNSVLFVYDVIHLLITKAYVLPLRIFVFYAWRLRQFKQLLKKNEIDVIILAEDNVGHGTGVFTRAARSRRLPVVTIPYTIANAREFAESYFDVPEHQISRWPNWWVRRLYPQYVHEHRGRKLMRLPGWHALAQEWLRLAPEKPWAYNSGRSDAVVVDSEHTVEYYRRAGLIQEPLLPLGALFDDELAGVLAESVALRRDLYVRHSLPHDKPLLVCALPPNQLPSRPQCPFIDFQELTRAWLLPLSRLESYNVVVSLHPRLEPSDFQWIEEEFGIPIVAGPTSALVPLCDVYLASVSATIRWAVACGRPVINYDVFEYHYDDYDDAAGVVTVFKQRDYEAVLRRLAVNDAWRDELRSRQEADPLRWGRLDGGAARRIIALFDELCGARRKLDHENGPHRPRPHGPTTSRSCDSQAA